MDSFRFQFPHIESAMIEALVSSSEGDFDVTFISTLIEVDKDARLGVCDMPTIPLSTHRVFRDSTLIFQCVADTLEVKCPMHNIYYLRRATEGFYFSPQTIGEYTFGHTDSVVVRVDTPLLRFAYALDQFLDSVSWMWCGLAGAGLWTERLEVATVELLSQADEIHKFFDPIALLMDSSTGSTYASSWRHIDNFLADVLEKHDGTAMGMTHTAMRDMFVATLRVNVIMGRAHENFSEAMRNFEDARWDAAPEAARVKVIQARDALLEAAQEAEPEIPRLRNVIDAVRACDLDLRMYLQFLPTMSLFPSAHDLIILPSVSLHDVLAVSPAESKWALDALVDDWTERLVCNGAIVGSVLQQFGAQEVDQCARVIQSLLYSGVAYVSQGAPKDQICALVDQRRGILHLQDALGDGVWFRGAGGASRRRRGKEIARLIRKARQAGIQWEVRITSDIDAALCGLQCHHSDNWVGPGLERVWRHMATTGALTVFELWAEINGKRVLVAADFGHAIGETFYVATRFYQKEYARWQPGYLLAFIEMRLLASAQFRLWDVGGVNYSPMMAYKRTITDVVDREAFLSILRRFRERHPSAPPAGHRACIVEENVSAATPLTLLAISSYDAPMDDIAAFRVLFDKLTAEGNTPTEAAVKALTILRTD